ncbi:MAG: protein translocase subunit SecD [Gemmatimonadaceae bacterium]|nr:protein translocase subunit SecD [Gemmatimonadaceae bacterium]
MTNLKYRLLTIVLLVLASVWALYPRTVVERVKRDGVFVFDTVKRVPLKRGLDLVGGMHLTLEIDESKGAVANKSEALDRALTVVRSRIDEFGVAEPLVQKIGNDRIAVELPGIDDPVRATEVVQKSAYLQFQITDKTQAWERNVSRLDGILRDKGIVAAAKSDTGKGAAKSALPNLFATGDTGKKAAGDSSATDSITSSNGPFATKVGKAPGGDPGMFMVAESDRDEIDAYLQHPDIKAALPPGKQVKWGADTIMSGSLAYRGLYVLDARPIITGEYLTDAKPNTVPGEGVIVEFQLNNEGGRRFKSETGKHVRDYMAIVLDDRVMSAPVIQSAIGTRGQITMGGSGLQAAQDLALVLRAGALPVPLIVADRRTIGASLGQDSIDKSIRAGLVAIAFVVLIMLVYYRGSGVMAVSGMVLYVLYTLAVLAFFGATLTLPGLAGFVLGIGIAVDANVLIFERIREELDHGKSVRTAIDEGFKHAMTAIIDTNVSTALTALVLYQYGTGPVKGFAVTLLAGLAATLVACVFSVRTFYLVWLNRNRGVESLSI